MAKRSLVLGPSTFALLMTVRAVSIRLPALLLLTGAPAPLLAQHSPSSSIELSNSRPASGCRITATVAGAGAGMFLGALIGYHVERAIYKSNEDAGVTGLAIGSIGGAIAGIQIARKACKEPGEDELRRQLRLQLPQQSSFRDQRGNVPPRAWRAEEKSPVRSTKLRLFCSGDDSDCAVLNRDAQRYKIVNQSQHFRLGTLQQKEVLH